MPALLINSVDAATLGLTLAEAPGWLDLPPRQFPTASILGRAGAKRLSDALEQPRRLTLRGLVRASTWAAARANIDALKLALLADPLSITFADHSDRHVFAVLESFTAPPLAGPFVQENLSVEATLTAYDPLSYDNALTIPVVTTNSILQSRNLTVTWTAMGTGAATQNAVGLDGTANSATTITDTDAAAGSYRAQTVTVPVDSNKHSIAYWVKKDTDQTRFVLCYAQITGGTGVTRGCWLNTQTGAFVASLIAGTGTIRVVDDGLWWVVEITLTNNSTALNTQMLVNVSPARGTTLGVDNVATTGSCVVGQVQVELNSPFYSSPIFTTTAAVTRIGQIPLGTGPIRPLVTINGASTNPVITLYNEYGVAIASITLTISTSGGDVLEIDMDLKTVKKNGVSALSAITAGDFFTIDPADQVNFSTPGPSIGSSSGALTGQYFRSWR